MFNSAILKLTAVCNMDCTYCYMFSGNDRTFTRVPRMMSTETACAAVDAIAEHVLEEELGTFNLVLHGGEPTIWPIASWRSLLARVACARDRGIDIKASVQTNGLQLRSELLQLFRDFSVSLGISIDGPKEHNDKYRITKTGEGTHDRIMQTVNRVLNDGYRDLLGGFLIVARPDVRPLTLFEWILRLPITRVDVLWPIEYNYDKPIYSVTEEAAQVLVPRFGSWFAELFDLWWARNDESVYIRQFSNLLDLALGGRNHIDALVNDQLTMLVINTDGQIEYPDYFRAGADGACRTRYNVHVDTLAAAATDERFRFCFDLASHLPRECEGCKNVKVCGGGFLPGRVGGDQSLARRSVLCRDQMFFFDHVSRAFAVAMPQRVFWEPVLGATTPSPRANIAGPPQSADSTHLNVSSGRPDRAIARSGRAAPM